MVDVLIASAQYFLHTEFLIGLVVGTLAGLVLGVIPGIGSFVGLALALSFAFVSTPELMLPLMVALSGAVFTGGSITAVLLNLPGTEANAATLMDGFPMAQKGQAGRALGAAVTASAWGGILSAFLALAAVPLILPLVFSIHAAEMVCLIVLGLSFLAVLSRESMLKGLISGGLGLMISLIGFQANTGLARFTFGSLYLYDGIGLVPMALGLFALPEMIALGMQGGAGTIASQGDTRIKRTGEVLEGVRDVYRHWRVTLSGSIIGFFVGVVPGIGALTAMFVSYGHAKQTARHPEKFGTGAVEGVLAAESANNASQAGALLTSLAFGIPGSAGMALLLAAIVLLGLVPGPEMLTRHLSLSIALVWTLIASNIVAALIILPSTRFLAKVALVPSRVLVPVVVVISFVGCYAFREEFNDVLVALLITVVGLVMRNFGYNRPALLLGFVLGTLFEQQFYLAYAIDGPLFFSRPGSLLILSFLAALYAWHPLKRLVTRKVTGRVSGP